MGHPAVFAKLATDIAGALEVLWTYPERLMLIKLDSTENVCPSKRPNNANRAMFLNRTVIYAEMTWLRLVKDKSGKGLYHLHEDGSHQIRRGSMILRNEEVRQVILKEKSRMTTISSIKR